MRLKKIKLAGFKSFVDPTTLELPGELTSVVGPNGCGKSNIIDAVRWVMGESSAKHLRGESMSDVIFNGSNTRKPVGQASVELLFDNSDGSLGGEYLKFSEISIRREAYRDNQSSYFLNGTKCRRKDIVDVFLGTGLGPRSYAIIEQGMISRVIEAKPEELRSFLEEAAGISLYRKRRQETETRMRHTRENLARIDDIRQELEKQLERLKRQSESAERYKLYKTDHDQLEAELTALRWRSLDAQLQERSLVIRKQAAFLEEKMAGKASRDLELEKCREKHSEETEQCSQIQGQYYRVGSEVTRQEQVLQNLKEREQQLQSDLNQTANTLQQLDSQLVADTDRLEKLRAILEQLAPERAAAELAATDGRAVLERAEEALRNWAEGFESFQRQAEASQRAAEVEKARIEQLERQTREADAQIKKLDQELAQLQAGLSDEALEACEKALLEEEAKAHQQASVRTQHLTALGEIKTQQEALVATSDGLKDQKRSLQGRLVSLEALQQAALGKTDEVIQAWLETSELSSSARLAQRLKVEPGYETAVETVLGSALEAVCVEGIQSLQHRFEVLTAGELMLIEPTSGQKVAVPLARGARGDYLSSKITADLPVQDLCRGVYVVDNLAHALQLRSELSAEESVVTRDGIWCGSNWLRVHRGQDGKSGILAREVELKHLNESLQTVEAELSALGSQQEEIKQERSHLEQTLESLLKEQQDHAHILRTLSSKLSSERARQEHTRNRLGRIEEEMKGQNQKLTLAQEETAIARQALEKSLDEMEGFAQRRGALQEEREKLRQLVSQANQNAKAAQERLHELALKHQGVKSQYEATVEGKERLSQHLKEANARQESLKTALQQAIQPQQATREALEHLLEERLQVEGELNQVRSAVDSLDQALRQLEKERNQFEQEAEQIRSELEQLRLDSQALEVRRETIQEKLAELNVSVETVLTQLPPEASDAEWADKLSQIAQKIQRLGAINLAAIEEYETELERKTYLDSQHQDLISALETLENAIRKIDRETRSCFKETYDKVNQSFQTLYPHLFGGGQAYLELQGEDLLEAGVTVMARPPGKRNSSIHLLSGGEKALTAVALVFAIFQLNPAPFCLLDEVDAPLDDANVGRFCRLVKELSSSVQFIFVTHNKIAMEMATHLVGVTMKEPGVSRLVSVNISEAVEMAVVAEEAA